MDEYLEGVMNIIERARKAKQRQRQW